MYNIDMPIDGKKTTKTNENGDEKDAYTVAFTNGALKEIEDLKANLELKSLEDVVQLSIALLVKLEKNRDESPTEA